MARQTERSASIDAVDRELLAALNRRAALAKEVGELKKREGSVVFRPEREAQVIDGLKAANPGPLKDDNVAPIWREIMSACRALETPPRVAYLGPAGTFSEQAALGFFGSSIVRVPCANFDEVFHATQRRRGRFRRGAGRELHRRRGHALARPVPDYAAASSSARPACCVRHNLLRTVELARRHRGGAAPIRRRWRNATAG